jgi:hypothetical protein
MLSFYPFTDNRNILFWTHLVLTALVDLWLLQTEVIVCFKKCRIIWLALLRVVICNFWHHSFMDWLQVMWNMTAYSVNYYILFLWLSFKITILKLFFCLHVVLFSTTLSQGIMCGFMLWEDLYFHAHVYIFS